MYLAVRKNFEEKVSYVARMVTDMTVVDQSSLLSIDCGLPSDTFNVMVVKDMSASAQILESREKTYLRDDPFAV